MLYTFVKPSSKNTCLSRLSCLQCSGKICELDLHPKNVSLPFERTGENKERTRSQPGTQSKKEARPRGLLYLLKCILTK
jgi:hypothetical protein